MNDENFFQNSQEVRSSSQSSCVPSSFQKGKKSGSSVSKSKIITLDKWFLPKNKPLGKLMFNLILSFIAPPGLFCLQGLWTMGLFGPREGEEVLSCNQTIVMVLFACLIVVVDYLSFYLFYNIICIFPCIYFLIDICIYWHICIFIFLFVYFYLYLFIILMYIIVFIIWLTDFTLLWLVNFRSVSSCTDL